MASKLGVYQCALRHIGERKLTSLADTGPSRYRLDDAYPDAVAHCLEQGLWNFAMRTVSLAASTGVTPQFGFTYAFEKPTDWVRTYVLSGSESLDPDLQARDEQTFWLSNYDTLFVRYVSNAAEYGNNVTRWPQTFADFAGARLAWLICDVTNQDMQKQARLDKVLQLSKRDALAKDALNEPAQFPPTGTWVRSRTRSVSFGSGWNC